MVALTLRPVWMVGPGPLAYPVDLSDQGLVRNGDRRPCKFCMDLGAMGAGRGGVGWDRGS